jgi:hypothetical protein
MSDDLFKIAHAATLAREILCSLSFEAKELNYTIERAERERLEAMARRGEAGFSRMRPQWNCRDMLRFKHKSFMS